MSSDLKIEEFKLEEFKKDFQNFELNGQFTITCVSFNDESIADNLVTFLNERNCVQLNFFSVIFNTEFDFSKLEKLDYVNFSNCVFPKYKLSLSLFNSLSKVNIKFLRIVSNNRFFERIPLTIFNLNRLETLHLSGLNCELKENIVNRFIQSFPILKTLVIDYVYRFHKKLLDGLFKVEIHTSEELKIYGDWVYPIYMNRSNKLGSVFNDWINVDFRTKQICFLKRNRLTQNTLIKIFGR